MVIFTVQNSNDIAVSVLRHYFSFTVG